MGTAQLAGEKRAPFSKLKFFKRVQFFEIYTLYGSSNTNKHFLKYMSWSALLYNPKLFQYFRATSLIVQHGTHSEVPRCKRDHNLVGRNLSPHCFLRAITSNAPTYLLHAPQHHIFIIQLYFINEHKRLLLTYLN